MIRTYIYDSVGVMGPALDVSVVMFPEPGNYDVKPRILRLGTADRANPEWEETSDDQVNVRPTFRIGHDEARTVLDALTRHFHGAEDTRALRADYDAERKRVDKLADALSSLALKLAEPA